MADSKPYQQPRRLLALLLFGLVAGLVMRWIFPEADPPLHRQTGALWFDECEGTSARNGIVFGSWDQDSWTPWAFVPLHNLLMHGSFLLFGLTGLGMRFPVMLLGTLLLPISYFWSRASGFSRGAAIVSAFLLATSWAVMGFSRTAKAEMVQLFFLSLTLALIVKAETASRRKCHWYVLAGGMAGMAFLSKVTLTPLLLALGICLLTGPVLPGIPRPWRWRLARTSTFTAATAAIIVAGLCIWVLPYCSARQQFLAVLQEGAGGRVGRGIVLAAYRAVAWLDSQAFFTTPFTLAAILLFAPQVLFFGTNEKDWATPAQRFALNWGAAFLLVGLCLSAFFDIPARRFLWANLLLAQLGAALYHRVHAAPPLELVDPGQGRGRMPVLFLACLASAALLVGGSLSPNGGLPAFLAPVFAAKMLFTMKLKIIYKLAWAALAFLGGLALFRLRPRILPMAGKVFSAALCLQLALFAGMSVLWCARLSYSVRDSSVAIGKALDRGTPVLGAAATWTAFYNQILPLYWSPSLKRIGNSDEAVVHDRFNPQYILVDEVTYAAMRAGTCPVSSYVASFLGNEIARYELYELHGTPHLKGDLILLQRGADTETPGGD